MGGGGGNDIVVNTADLLSLILIPNILYLRGGDLLCLGKLETQQELGMRS